MLLFTYQFKKVGANMNQKGFTLIELLIVIVVLGIIATFGVVAFGTVISNSREDSFVSTATTMISSASFALNKNDDLWNDNIATLQELIDNDYIEVYEDPWGAQYDKVNSVVTMDLVVKHNDGFYLSNSFYLDSESGGSTGISGIIETITGNTTGTITGNEDNDVITVTNNVSSNGEINTLDGDDIVTIGNDLSGSASVDTGAGNDTVIIENDTRASATINTGDGNDTIQVDRWLRGRSTLDAGSGNDIITIGEIRYHTQTRAGEGNDTVTINSVLNNFRGVVDLGSGDDTLTISDAGTPFSGVNATFSGGSGNDTLTLLTVNTARWNQISHMFTGFETIILTDGTIIN